MTKEKKLETQIVNYLKWLGAWVEQLQAGRVLIKKWAYSNMMNLCSNGTPDIICLYKWNFYWIEVKKNKEEYDNWIKAEIRLENEWRLPKYLEREKTQIEHKKHILEQEWTHILTYQLEEIIEYFNNK